MQHALTLGAPSPDRLWVTLHRPKRLEGAVQGGRTELLRYQMVPASSGRR